MKNKKYYIYLFKNSADNVIYVGKTSRNVYRRIREHIRTKSWILSVIHIFIAELDSPVEQDIAEIYYINKYKPKYNNANKYENIKETSDIIKVKNLYFHELSIVECLMIGGCRSVPTSKIKKKEIIFLNYFNIFNPMIYEEYKNSFFRYKELTIEIRFTEKEMLLIDYLEGVNCLRNLLTSADASLDKIKDEIYCDILQNLTKEKLKIIVNDTVYNFIDKFVFLREKKFLNKLFLMTILKK